MRLPRIIVTIFLAGAVVQARQGEVFRSRTELVSVAATATDTSRRLVTDLREDEVVVLDNGKPQKLALFSADAAPLSVAVMLDRSGSMADHFGVLRNAATEFVRTLGPADRARIGDFGTRIQIRPAAFTTDRIVLMDLLRRGMQQDGPSPVWNSVDAALTAVEHEPGRRVVLLFTDGHDAPSAFQDHVKFNALVKRVRQTGVMVYAIGVWVPADIVTIGGVPALPLNRELEQPDEGLETLARESGGGYFDLDTRANGPSLSETFARVGEELRRQYALAFAPARLDGKTHALQIKATRPGVTVRARASYVAR